MTTINEILKRDGCQLDSHESDLYVDEDKIRELWELLEAALRIRDLRPKPSFLDSCLTFSVICAVWAAIAFMGAITAYLMTELIPGFSDWLRTL